MPPLFLVRHELAHEGDLGIYVRRGQGKLKTVVGKPDVVRGDDAVAVFIYPLPAPLEVCARAEGLAQDSNVIDPLRSVVDDSGQHG